MLKRIGVASVAVLLMAAMAQAQPPGQGRGRGGPGGFGFGFGRGGGFGMGYAQLVGVEEVQKELKITEDQKATLQKQSDERRAAAREQQGQGGGRGLQDFQNLSDEERRERFEQFRKDAAEREKKTREQIATVLDEAQLKRLREIWIQQAGVGALSNDEVAAELKITDLQKEEIADTQQEAFREMGEQMRELFQGGGQGGDRDAARAKMEELRKQADEKVLANLNDDQKKQFEAMKGAKFEMPQGAFGFGGRGRGGRPGGDGADGGGRRPGGDGGNNGGGNRPRRPDSV